MAIAFAVRLSFLLLYSKYYKSPWLIFFFIHSIQVIVSGKTYYRLNDWMKHLRMTQNDSKWIQVDITDATRLPFLIAIPCSHSRILVEPIPSWSCNFRWQQAFVPFSRNGKSWSIHSRYTGMDRSVPIWYVLLSLVYRCGWVALHCLSA